MARETLLSVESDHPESVFMITGADPDKITWFPRSFHFEAELLFFALPIGEPFVPNLSMFDNPSAKSLGPFDGYGLPDNAYIQIHTSKELHLAMLGPVPLGAYIPVTGSTVRLANKVDQATGDTTAIIEEKFKKLFSAPLRPDELASVHELPMVDLLGQDVVIWTDDVDVQITCTGIEKTFSMTRLRDNKSGKIVEHRYIAAVRIKKSPFATRVAYFPSTVPYKDQFRTGQPIPGINWDSGSGKVSLKINNPGIQSQEYGNVYRYIKTNPTVEVKDINVDAAEFARLTGIPVEPGSVVSATPPTIKFRYPPVPANAGFNIFGPVEKMEFGAAMGAVNIDGSEDIPLLTPSKLTFTGIQKLKLTNVAIETPIKFESNTADFQFSADSTVTLNGEPLARKWTYFRSYISWFVNVLWVITAITTFNGVMPGVKAVWQKVRGPSKSKG